MLGGACVRHRRQVALGGPGTVRDAAEALHGEGGGCKPRHPLWGPAEQRALLERQRRSQEERDLTPVTGLEGVA